MRGINCQAGRFLPRRQPPLRNHSVRFCIDRDGLILILNVAKQTVVLRLREFPVCPPAGLSQQPSRSSRGAWTRFFEQRQRKQGPASSISKQTARLEKWKACGQ